MNSPPGENDTTSASGSESKKRNKLGYHRTTIACGHCRRRKIRCIPSAHSNEPRCQNCIRLKKVCQFHPVESNSSVASKEVSNSKVEFSDTEFGYRKRSNSADATVSHKTNAFETPLENEASLSGVWNDNGYPVSSPSELTGEHDYQVGANHSWGTASGQQNMHNYFGQSQEDLAGGYWSQQHATTMAYSQQKYMSAGPSPFSPSSGSDYHGQGFNEQRYTQERQSFSEITSPAAGQSQISHQNYGATFPELSRSMTAPVEYRQNNPGGTNFHTGTQGHGSDGGYGQMQAYPSQLAHASMWYSAQTEQPGFGPGYLPPQQYRNPRRMQYPG